MITTDNLKECFDNLTVKEINKVMDSNKDYVLLWLHIFNSGFYASVKPYVYSDRRANYAAANEQIFCDKDDFLRLFVESGSTNEAFNDYI